MRRVMSISLALLLLVSGLLIAYRVHLQMRENVISQHGEKLEEVVNSVDWSAHGRLYDYQEMLKCVTGRRAFIEAENIWLETGNTEELLFRIEENLLIQRQGVKTILAIQNGSVMLSVDGETGYALPEQQEDMFICTDVDGNFYLGISCSSREVSYAVLLDLDTLCDFLAESSAVNNADRMILMDRNREVVISCKDGITTVELPTEEVVNQSPAQTLAWQAIGTDYRETNHYEVKARDGRETTGFALIGDGGSQNGFFTICILDAYDEHLHDLKVASVQIIACCGVILLGLMLLLSYINKESRKAREVEEEVAQLKERQQTLEKINEQTQQLAHHQRLETIGTLTSSISHEFNNLLTPIMSYSLLTLEKLPADEVEIYDNVLEIYNASRKAKVIISRLSDLARKNTQKHFQEASVDDLIKKALDIALPAKPENVEIKLNLNCWDIRIPVNEIQICQMLLNLIINAFQAMPEGGVLEIQTIFDDDLVKILVTDTGDGIPEDIRDRIFDPFFTTKESGKGTGLGLAIVAQMVEDHKGTVELLDTEKRGSSFRICLPRKTELN